MANIQHVLPLKAKLLKRERTAQTFGPDGDNLLVEYKELMKAVELRDMTEATARLEHAISTRREARSRSPKTYKTDKEVANAILSGEVDMRRFDVYLAKIPTAKEFLAMRSRERKLLESVAVSSYRMGLRTIREHGEGFQKDGEPGWLRDLKQIADAAVTDKDQEKYTAVHALFKFLRSSEVSALSMGACSGGARPSDLPLIYYQFRNFDEVHRFRLERASKITTRMAIPAGANTFIYSDVRIGPMPKVADFLPGWGASLNSAEEALANAAAIYARQDREIDESKAEPETRPRRKAVIA
jgi:hypothetical protein